MAIEHFLKVHQSIDARWFERFLVSEFNNLLHIEFYASPYGKAFAALLEILREDDIASRLRSLKFHAPDEGANGTREWDFSTLVESEAMFPKLRWLSIEQYDEIGHNRPVVGSVDEEHGILARWLAKAPELSFLSSPSAPDAGFFKITHPSLEILQIQAGYDTQNFIMNFSQSGGFPALRYLDYTDYNERYMDDYPQRCTPLEHFRELFKSKAFASVTTFIWHDPVYAMQQLRRLKMLRPDLYFRTTHFSVLDV